MKKWDLPDLFLLTILVTIVITCLLKGHVLPSDQIIFVANGIVIALVGFLGITVPLQYTVQQQRNEYKKEPRRLLDTSAPN